MRDADRRWLDAVTVAGQLASIVTFTYAARLVLLELTHAPSLRYWHDLDYSPPWQLWPPLIAWAAVLVIVMLSRRHRSAAGLAAVATTLDVIRVTASAYRHEYLDAWPLLAGAVTTLVLVGVAARPGSARLGRVPLTRLAGAAALGVGSVWMDLLPPLPPLNRALPPHWTFPNGVTAAEALMLGLAAVLGLVALLSTPAAVRRRLLALLTPVGAILLLARFGAADGTVLSRPYRPGDLGVEPVRWLILGLIPSQALAVVAALVQRRERARPTVAVQS